MVEEALESCERKERKTAGVGGSYLSCANFFSHRQHIRVFHLIALTGEPWIATVQRCEATALRLTWKCCFDADSLLGGTMIRADISRDTMIAPSFC
jgi:hypothetical protein